MNALLLTLDSKLTSALHESSPKKYHALGWVFAIAVWVTLGLSILVGVLSLIRGYDHGILGNAQPQETLNNTLPLIQCPYCGGVL